ncbi:MAG: DNA-directed RNA polymerase subunit alpha [Candidatus Hodgkinia cicadicola]|nr:MAG: DNA-directed RNA polymerase subunit alpha [Candidatus Hodgkinia cicadicola]
MSAVELKLGRLGGVKQDAVDLALSLKRLVFGSEASAVVFKGVLLANPQGEAPAYSVCYLTALVCLIRVSEFATLSPRPKLKVELVTARGAECLCAEAVRSSWSVRLKGFIALDANFSHVKRVSYNIVESEHSFASCDKVSMLVESDLRG